jgi:hypothetical protein
MPGTCGTPARLRDRRSAYRVRRCRHEGQSVRAAKIKGTSVGFPDENAAGFRFTCEADLIDYWLRCARLYRIVTPGALLAGGPGKSKGRARNLPRGPERPTIREPECHRPPLGSGHRMEARQRRRSVTTGQERAVFDEQMSRCQALLDRCQATGDPQLILAPDALAQARALAGWATGSATWGDARHVCAWLHWLRFEVLGDARGAADRQQAEQLFRDQYRTRPADLPEPVRKRLDNEVQQLFASVMAQVAQEARRRRPNRQRLQELMGPLQMICNLTSRGDRQYLDRLNARAQVAELARDPMADIYRQDARNARTEKARQPSAASPPWRPFDWETYFDYGD